MPKASVTRTRVTTCNRTNHRRDTGKGNKIINLTKLPWNLEGPRKPMGIPSWFLNPSSGKFFPRNLPRKKPREPTKGRSTTYPGNFPKVIIQVFWFPPNRLPVTPKLREESLFNGQPPGSGIVPGAKPKELNPGRKLTNPWESGPGIKKKAEPVN